MKKSELDGVLRLLRQGKTKAEIKEILDIKSTALSNRLRRLENLGCIERQGKYLIKVLSSSHKHPKVTKNLIIKKLNKRGHAFNFKVVFAVEQNLLQNPKVRQEFKQKKLEQLKFGSLKLSKDHNSIWINKESLTIYSSNSFYSGNALHSKFRALKDIDNLIIYLKNRYGFKGSYGIEVFREHYGLIFNKFAKWPLSKGRKLYVKNKGNKTILWVDDSRKDDVGLTEFEGEDPMMINNADTFFDSHEKTNWKNNAFVVEQNTKDINDQKQILGKSMQVLESYAEQIALHLKVEKRIEQRLDKMDERDERFTKAIEELSKNTQKGKV